MNEYENAALLNPNAARAINESAMTIVKRAVPILEEVEGNPALENMHHPETGGRYRGHYLGDVANALLKTYGVVCRGSLEVLPGVPEDVKGFVRRAGKYMSGMTFAYGV